MDEKNPFNEARKARRKIINERNAMLTSKKTPAGGEKRNLDKESRIDLSRKDNKSPKGLYV